MKESQMNTPAAMSPWVRASRAMLALSCALAIGAALTSTPATAKVIHKEEGSFSGSDAPEGPFTGFSMSSAATDQSNGDVYVLEANVVGVYGHSVVDKFDANGKYAGVHITGSQTPQGSFGFALGILHAYGYGAPGLSGVAVDSTTAGPNKGDVYVADTEHGVVDRFTSAGTFECQITGKAPSSAEEIAHECNGATGSLTPDGSIEPAGLAISPNGTLYVADEAHEAIDEFGPSGEYTGRQIKSSHLKNESGLGLGSMALDSAGTLYVTNFNNDIVKFDSSGNFVEVIGEGEHPYSVGVDPRNDHLYVSTFATGPTSGNSQEAIAEYEPSGVLLDVFAYTESISYVALAVGPTGKVYAGESSFSSGPTEVLIYSPDVILPNITTFAATSVEESTAALHGHVDPDVAHNGPEVTSCQFEYGPTKAYGFTAPCAPGPNYSTPTDVSATIDELQPKSIYHFRLEAANSNGTPSYGEDQTLATRGAPTIDRQAAEALQTTVNFRAHVNPWGYDATCQLQYVTDASFQQSRWANATTTPCSPEHIGSGFGDVLVKLKVEDLERETSYHYRFLATNQAGLAGHPAGTFETYGIREYSVEDRNSASELETQAGAHPYELITNMELSKTTQFIGETEHVNFTAVNTKDIKVDLPPGVIGNPTATPLCNRFLVNQEACPSDTQVGTLELWLGKYIDTSSEVQPLPSERAPSYDVPLFNLEPSGRYPAEFGAFIEGQAGAWITFHVRTGSDYGVSADSLDIVSTGVPERVKVHVWGVPADPAHNTERSCPVTNGYGKGSECPPFTEPLKPLLTNPTSCSGPQTSTAMIDSWQEPGEYVSKTAELPGFTGCGKLRFEPSLRAEPTTGVADSPSGLHVDLHMPQPEGCKEEGGKVACEGAEADLRDAKVTLPAGLTVDPSSADGLAACSEAQIGYLPQQSAEAGRPQFTPDPAGCPDASKIGNVEVDTPLLEHSLPGAVYIATQGANPFKSLLALYVAVYDPQTNVVVKLPGKVTLDPVTGQMTATFDDNPQLPFNDFKLDFFGGNEAVSKSRAALTTPLTCGSYAASAVFTPWSAPEGANVTPEVAPFKIGGACVGSEAQAPNGPGFEAGTVSPVADTFSPFALHLKREDGSQRFSGLNVTLPPGLTGKIAGLQQCPQAQIEAAMARSHEGEGASELAHPSCPSGSEVGVVHVGSGSGAPYYVKGHAYFAGPYRGAPFSLVIVTPAVAGPFDLGTVVVRSALFIDPSTAQVTVKSDPFPTILDGIPLDIRSIGVEMNRKEFTLNPTSCNSMSVTGQEASTAGQTAALSDRFQAGGCTTLPFHPTFTVSTSGKTSRRDGASLTVHVGSSVGQANIAKVHVELPKQLPSRLDTLKLACTERVFAADPASCPQGSVVGTAVAHTPILSSPLTGPAYIVSHGGAAFPDLEIVLSAEGVTIVLDGKTDIKHGITSSSFESVPDAPVSSFELSLPEGPHSILAAPGGNLCSFATGTLLVKKKVTVKVRRHGHVVKRRVTRTVKETVPTGLLMPTRIQGQNGAVVDQKTHARIAGCAAAVTPKTVKNTRKRHKKRRK